MATPVYGEDGGDLTSNGNGFSFPAVTLNDATGDEVAYTIEYTTDKATSGADTGLIINQTDTLSPGVSDILMLQRNGGQVFKVGNLGAVNASSNITGAAFIGLSLRTSANNVALQLQPTRDFTTADKTAVEILGNGNEVSNTSGFFHGVVIQPDYNQASGTASNTDVLINRDETGGIGSGAQRILDLQADSDSKFSVDNKGLVAKKATAGITADTGSSQGDGPLLVGVNQVSVCANAGDAGTMPEAIAGISYTVTIINNGAQAMDIFPFSGDNLGAGVNIAVSLAAGADITYTSYDDTNWLVLT